MIRLATALTIAFGWFAASEPPAPCPALDQDDVAIIRAAIDSTIVPEVRRVALSGHHPITLLIDQTVKLCDAEGRRVRAWPCMIPDLEPRGLPRQRKTETSFQVPELDLPSVQLVAPDVVHRFFDGGSRDRWRALDASFPGARSVAQVSAPAYVGEDALVYTSYSCGALCGEGWLVRLTRKEGRWQVVDRSMLWIS